MEKVNFVCIMEDGSEFRMPLPEWDEALSMKYPIEDWEEIKKIFKDIVTKHWQERTIPTKFGWDEPWDKEYKNHAELGEDVMYQYIRAPLLGLILAKKTEGKSKVAALSDEGVTIYSDKESEQMSMDKFLEAFQLKDKGDF